MNIEEFIKERIKSVDELRAVLLFHAHPDIVRDADETAGKLYIPPEAAAKVLARLAANGILTVTGEPPRYRFQPQTQELERLIQELAKLDKERPVTLIKLVYSRPEDIQAFANAFKIKKET